MTDAIKNDDGKIVALWEKHFSNKKKNIAIYGIGKWTKLILDTCDCGNIMALLDETHIGECIYGKPVISVEAALAQDVDIIVIVARSSNIKTIYRRIRGICKANKVDVYDIRGNSLDGDKQNEKILEKYRAINKSSLREKIALAEVVCFDVFDTLLTRRVLYPDDVFALLAQRNGIENFASLRKKAEAQLSREGGVPNIYDIYQQLGSATAKQEIETETEIMLSRKAMVDMLDYALAQMKIVYLASDMYLPKQVIKELLDNLGIHMDISQILVSCDFAVSKSNGLFTILRNMVGDKKILHIGDNYEADMEAALRYGIDDIFAIESGLSMLEDSSAESILDYDGTLQNRLVIGEFVAMQFNDPFAFLAVSDEYAQR